MAMPVTIHVGFNRNGPRASEPMFLFPNPDPEVLKSTRHIVDYVARCGMGAAKSMAPLILSGVFGRVLDFHYLSVVLYDAAQHVMRLHTLETSVRGRLQAGAAFGVEDIPSGWVWEHQQPLVVRDIAQEPRFPRVMEALREHAVRSFCCLPLTTAQRRLGALAIGQAERGAYSSPEVAFAQLVAAHVAVAVDNALHAQEAQALQQQLARAHDRLHLLLEVNNRVVAHLDLRSLFQAIAASLRRVMPCDYVGVALADVESHQRRLSALDFPTGQGFLQEDMLLPM
jgi:formate hydrogenlyase transcriptional activator